MTLNVGRVFSVSGMFQGCLSLKYLDLSNFNANEIKLRSDFFPTEVTNVTVILIQAYLKELKVFSLMMVLNLKILKDIMAI